MLKMLKDAMEKEITHHDQLNDNMGKGNAYQRSRPSHCTLIAQTQAGLKNLLKLISISHIDYFYRVPRLPRSQLKKVSMKESWSDRDVIKGKFLKG